MPKGKAACNLFKGHRLIIFQKMSQASFHCPILQVDVTIEKWERWSKILRAVPSAPAHQKIFHMFGVETRDEYIELVRKCLKDSDLLSKTMEKFHTKSMQAIEQRKKEDEEFYEKEIKKSTRTFHKHVTVRLLGDKDENLAHDLFTKLLQATHTNSKDAEDIQSHIIKCQAHGLFVPGKTGGQQNLAAIAIINEDRRVLIDNADAPVKTFYIQGLYIAEEYRNLGYAKILFSYCILRCPPETRYISLFTQEKNSSLIHIAKKFGFIMQTRPSGDPTSPLLFIRFQDSNQPDSFTQVQITCKRCNKPCFQEPQELYYFFSAW